MSPAKDPIEGVMRLRRAVVLQARGEHAAAIEEFGRAIEADPDCTEAWAGRGISREVLGDAAGARADYTRSIQIEVNAEIARQASA